MSDLASQLALTRTPTHLPLSWYFDPEVAEVERKLLKFAPDEFKQGAHHWLILHGRYTCVARTPKCPVCIVRDLCEYRPKTKGAPPPRPLSN